MNFIEEALTWVYAWASSLISCYLPTAGIKPCSGPNDMARCIADHILNENGGPAYQGGLVVNVSKGTVIHKISNTTADTLAEIIISASKQTGLPISYGMACLCAESLFDPWCQNGNYLGSNKEKSPDGYDVGIAQLKLKYLVGQDGVTDIDSARSFALDPSKAIPYCFKMMSGRLTTADEFIAAPHDDHSDYAGFANKYYVATAMYNFGKSGFLAMDHHSPLPHCEIVKRYEVIFATSLGVPSIFGDLHG